MLGAMSKNSFSSNHFINSKPVLAVQYAVCVFSGSHDTMSYCLDISSPLVRSESDLFRVLDGLCCCLTRPTVFKWATTQVEPLEIIDRKHKPGKTIDLSLCHQGDDSRILKMGCLPF